MSAKGLIIAHGGSWVNNVYEGGQREYMPVPGNGITFDELLDKLEMRVMKERTSYRYDIDALFESPGCEVMRMKITDDFELTHLLSSVEMPILHVSVSCIGRELAKHVLRHPAAMEVSASSHVSSSDKQSDEVHDVYEVVEGEYVDEEEDLDNLVGLNDYGDNHDSDYDVCCGRDCHKQASGDVSDEENGDDHHPTSQWIIPGAAYQSSIPCRELGIEEDESSSEEFRKGGLFSNKDRLLVACGVYHLVNHSAFSTVRSSPQRYHIVCKFGGGCPFIVRGKALGKMWLITEFVPHSCEMDLRYHAPPKVSSRVLASYFIPELMVKGVTLRPKAIQALLQQKYGVHVKYNTALAGRNLALKRTYGDPDTSFHILTKYIYMLEKVNPGSVVDLQTDENNVFEYVYTALSACINAYKLCRPMIVVDGTHLKGKYKGILFVAVAKDANEQIVPLAFGIGDKECDASWIWFFNQLRKTFGVREELVFVTDQHPSISNAIEQVFPEAHHALCGYHIQNNIKHWGSDVVEIYKLAARAYKVNHFEQHMENLKAVKAKAYDKLMKMGPSRWARSHCPVRRYLLMTSNPAECMNNCLRWSRRLPVCTLLETIREKIGVWFYERRVIATERPLELDLSDWASMRLAKSVHLGLKMSVQPISSTKFEVKNDDKSYVVYLESHTCTCLVFQFQMIPCPHAAAAIGKVRQKPSSYVNAYFSTASLREIYSGEVMPLPNPEDWRIPPDIALRVVQTPGEVRQAGRPREKRIKSGGSGPYRRACRSRVVKSGGSSSSVSRLCSRCHEPGHFDTTCKLVVPLKPREEVSSSELGVTGRRKRRCSICKSEDHNRSTCSLRFG